MFNSNARDTQNNFRPHVLWSRGRLWLLCGGWSGDDDFASVETKFWLLLFFSLPLDCCRRRAGEIQSSALTLETCWTASQSMMLALTCLLFRWFKSCNNPYFQYRNQNKPFSSYVDCELSYNPWRHQSTLPVLVTTGTPFNLISSLISSWDQVPKNYENCPFYFWFHTAFVKDNSLILTRYADPNQMLCFPSWSWW